MLVISSSGFSMDVFLGIAYLGVDIIHALAAIDIL